MDYTTYILFRFFILLFRFIPFRILYFFSDVVAVVLFRLVRYRSSVVMMNLRRSFPQKPEFEIKRIANAFYTHLADMLVESLKSFSMSEKAVVGRYRYFNTDLLEKFYREGKSVICVAGHYGNWEWGGIASGLQLMHKPVGFYKPLSNKYIDAHIQKTRVKGRSVLASITNTGETFNTNWGEPAIFYMVSDQSPSSARLAYWVDFMNQDTAVLHGPEKYARIQNFPVVFACAKKVSRGHYHVFFQLLEVDPSKTKTGQITGRFMKALEEQIISDPEYYLWSHRRWKLRR